MPKTRNRDIKILGALWLGLGSLGFVYAFTALFPLTQGYTPSATAVNEGYWIYILGALVIGTIGAVNGIALLRRYPVARRLLAITSLVLFLPAAVLVLPLLVVIPSLWLTSSGKAALQSYMAREGDEQLQPYRMAILARTVFVVQVLAFLGGFVLFLAYWIAV